MDRFMVSIDPMFVLKIPIYWLRFVFSLEGFEIEVIKLLEIWVVLLVVGDSDFFVGVSEVPGEVSS